MKLFVRILILTLALSLMLTVYALAAETKDIITITIEGENFTPTDAQGTVVYPFLENGTTYLPVRALANAFSVAVEWDDATQTVFLGTKGGSPTQGDAINIYLNGAAFTAKDASGTAVYPKEIDGTTYLPVRAIGEAFHKAIGWDEATRTVSITTPKAATFDASKTYALTVAEGGAIQPLGGSTASGAALEVAEFTGAKAQLWKFVPVAVPEGATNPADYANYYNIINVASECAMDVSGNSTTPGAKILQYTLGTGENQMFMAVAQPDGTFKLYGKHSQLPFENSAGDVKQNAERTSSVQNWNITITEEVAQQETTKLYKLISSTNTALTATSENALRAESYQNNTMQHWMLVPTASGDYLITTQAGDRSLDVANQSTTDGDPIISYQTSSADNQRWVLEKIESDGSYRIKSVHSSLYLAFDGASVVQSSTPTLFRLELVN